MNWTCPYCDRDQVVTDKNFGAFTRRLYQDASPLGKLAFRTFAITCANASCKRLSLRMHLCEWKDEGPNGRDVLGEVHHEWNLLPKSQGKPQPGYIPRQIREDYEEACNIRDLSPKASATLSRRCLQGMIRDFCKISKARLVDEIDELRRQAEAGIAVPGVLVDTVSAIDAVRSIGNIGAHMERDIDVIVEIDPGEAQTLIALIELLFREWYVARHQRQDRLAALAKLAGVKKLERKAAPKALAAPPKALPAPDAE